MSSPAILLDNPKGENQSWEDWGIRLAEKHKSPTSTPNLPLAPGKITLREHLSHLYNQTFRDLIDPRFPRRAAETWTEYGDQWKDYYDSLSEAPVISPPNPTDGILPPTLPALPPPGSSGDAWVAWGTSVGQAYAKYGKFAGLKYDLAPPQTPTDGNWTAYGDQWVEYGRKLAERAKGSTTSI